MTAAQHHTARAKPPVAPPHDTAKPQGRPAVGDFSPPRPERSAQRDSVRTREDQYLLALCRADAGTFAEMGAMSGADPFHIMDLWYAELQARRTEERTARCAPASA